MALTKPAQKPRFATALGALVVTPAVPKQDSGWVVEKPPLEYFNWLHLWTYNWIEWVDQAAFDKTGDTMSGDMLLDWDLVSATRKVRGKKAAGDGGTSHDLLHMEKSGAEYRSVLGDSAVRAKVVTADNTIPVLQEGTREHILPFNRRVKVTVPTGGPTWFRVGEILNPDSGILGLPDFIISKGKGLNYNLSLGIHTDAASNYHGAIHLLSAPAKVLDVNAVRVLFSPTFSKCYIDVRIENQDGAPRDFYFSAPVKTGSGDILLYTEAAILALPDPTIAVSDRGLVFQIWDSVTLDSYTRGTVSAILPTAPEANFLVEPDFQVAESEVNVGQNPISFFSALKRKILSLRVTKATHSSTSGTHWYRIGRIAVNSQPEILIRLKNTGFATGFEWVGKVRLGVTYQGAVPSGRFGSIHLDQVSKDNSIDRPTSLRIVWDSFLDRYYLDISVVSTGNTYETEITCLSENVPGFIPEATYTIDPATPAGHFGMESVLAVGGSTDMLSCSSRNKLLEPFPLGTTVPDTFTTDLGVGHTEFAAHGDVGSTLSTWILQVRKGLFQAFADRVKLSNALASSGQGIEILNSGTIDIVNPAASATVLRWMNSRTGTAADHGIIIRRDANGNLRFRPVVAGVELTDRDLGIATAVGGGPRHWFIGDAGGGFDAGTIMRRRNFAINNTTLAISNTPVTRSSTTVVAGQSYRLRIHATVSILDNTNSGTDLSVSLALNLLIGASSFFTRGGIMSARLEKTGAGTIVNLGIGIPFSWEEEFVAPSSGTLNVAFFTAPGVAESASMTFSRMELIPLD